MECPVCYEEYSSDVSLKRRPQILPCGHEACESCLQQLHLSNNQVIKCHMCKTRHRVNPSSLPVVYAMIQDSTTAHKCKTGACRKERFGNDRKVAQLRETPARTVSLQLEPLDLAVVKDTRGFSLKSGVVVRGRSGSALPSPALLVTLNDVDDHLLVCDENGQVTGTVQLKHEHPSITRMAVTENENDLIITDSNNKCVMKLLLSGEIITTSQPGVFSNPLGLCCLADDRVAVCDIVLQSVQILSQTDLSLITSLRHPHFIVPREVTATSSHLIVTNFQSNARLFFFSLRDFSFVKLGNEELNEPTKLLHYKGNIFISTAGNDEVIQMSESGTPISTVGSYGVGDSQFNFPLGLAFIDSRNRNETLVVADVWNSRLKFYKL